MTFLAPAKSVNLVLLPLHLGVARKPDPLQPHQTPEASMLRSPHPPQYGKVLIKFLSSKPWGLITANSVPSVVTAV